MNKYAEYRREFHHYPENGWTEIRTSARIAEILTEMGYKPIVGEDVCNMDSVVDLCKPTKEQIDELMKKAVEQGANKEYVDAAKGIPGVIAIYDTGVEGPTTAFRFDIDCLPYDEPQEKGFRPFDEGFISCNPGAVHACGHDTHTAIGLGLADTLMNGKHNVKKGKIKMIFQPAEETYGGALSIVDKGHLDDCDYFISQHIALMKDGIPLTSHKMVCGTKDLLGVRQVDLHIHGYAAHPCSDSQNGRNAILCACQIALAVHGIAPHSEGLARVNVGQISGGIAPNTIAPEATVTIEYRGETQPILKYMHQRVFEIINGITAAYGCTYTYDDYGETAAGKSDDKMMEVIKRAAEKTPWFSEIYYEGEVGGTDDAAVMMNRVQEKGGIGAYWGIGTDTTVPVHNAKFDLDEDCIMPTIELTVNALEELHA